MLHAPLQGWPSYSFYQATSELHHTYGCLGTRLVYAGVKGLEMAISVLNSLSYVHICDRLQEKGPFHANDDLALCMKLGWL